MLKAQTPHVPRATTAQEQPFRNGRGFRAAAEAVKGSLVIRSSVNGSSLDDEGGLSVATVTEGASGSSRVTIIGEDGDDDDAGGGHRGGDSDGAESLDGDSKLC